MTSRHACGCHVLLTAITLALSCRSSVPNAAPRPEAGPAPSVARAEPAAPSQGEMRVAKSIGLAGGERGVGFDDLVFARPLHKLIVPAGGTGKLALIDPESMAASTIAVGAASKFAGGHDHGVTSADSDGTSVFAIDRSAGRLLVVNPLTASVQASVPLSGHPDYVRWVGATKELWIAEPDEERIEVFSWTGSGKPSRAGEIRVAGGPESLVIDESGQRAFTHLWRGVTLAIDLSSRSVRRRWSNGCAASRGIAYDPLAKVVLAACAEGKLVTLDAERDERQISAVRTSAGGVDVIAYSSALRHVYAPAAEGGEMTVAALSEQGTLRTLGVIPTARGAHCAAADDAGHVWVCDPVGGRLLAFDDALR